MVHEEDLVVWLSNCEIDDAGFVGGKAANLGEMLKSSFPVPIGFALTANAYFTFLRDNKLDLKIRHLLGSINYDDSSSIAQVTWHIRQMIKTSPIPAKIVKEVFGYYKKLGLNTPVAVRSSALSEDSKKASFAGQQATFLNVQGESVLMEKIREGWTSLYEARAVYYRHESKLDTAKAGMALVVQKMVQSEASGVMFTLDPVQNDRNKIIIEAVYGLGEYIVQGKVTPDHYELNKSDLAFTEKTIHEQRVMFTRIKNENKEDKIPKSKQNLQKISDKEILVIAKLGIELEKHYFFPQDVEWAKEKDKIYLVQTRPITTIQEKGVKKSVVNLENQFSNPNTPILIGNPAGSGVGIGEVKIIKSPSDMALFKPGMVFVAKTATEDYIPLMKKAAAIITEVGGRTSHASIVAREFGIPAVVGATLATEKLDEGATVTVMGRTGEVFEGSIKTEEPEGRAKAQNTATKIFLHVLEKESAEKISQIYSEGVGILTGEFIAQNYGKHPKKILEERKQNDFMEHVVQELAVLCKAFYPRTVFYKPSDLTSLEFRKFPGGKSFEPDEENPLLGFHGTFRNIHDLRIFALEAQAIKKVREKLGLTNISIMIPFVRTVQEFKLIRDLLHKEGLKRSHTFKFYLSVSLPTNAILIDDFIDEGIDGVTVDLESLTTFFLGIDKGNSEVAGEFDPKNKSVLWAVDRIIRSAREHGIPSGIYGHNLSHDTELLEKLVFSGIETISVASYEVNAARSIIYKAEQKLIRQLVKA